MVKSLSAGEPEWFVPGPTEFAALFGGTPEEVVAWCAPFLERFDFTCRRLEGEERDAYILAALKRLDPAAVSVAGPERKPDWESGWSENLRDFVDGGYDLDALVPKYMRPGQAVRLMGEYMQPRAPYFVRDYTKVFRAWLARRFMAS